MRHAHAGRKLGVDPSHRKAMLRSLTLSLIERETIRTTVARAKEARRWADRVVTLAKRGDLPSTRLLLQWLGNTKTNHGTNRVRKAITKLSTSLAPRFQGRAGGYTRIVRLTRPRVGDQAEMCILQYLPEEKKASPSAKPKKSRGRVRSEIVAEPSSSGPLEANSDEGRS